MTTFVFSTQFYPDHKNDRPALSIGYFLSDFSWKWYVLLFSTLLYIYFFNFGSESACCAKTLHGCLVFMKYPPTLIKMQAKPSY